MARPAFSNAASLTNAFLPAIVFFGGYFSFFLWGTNRLPGAVHAIATAQVSSQLILLVAALALAWFWAAFIASQWRNLIRLYEGYLFAGPLRQLAELGKLAHRSRRVALKNAGKSRCYEHSRRPEHVPPPRRGCGGPPPPARPSPGVG